MSFGLVHDVVGLVHVSLAHLATVLTLFFILFSLENLLRWPHRPCHLLLHAFSSHKAPSPSRISLVLSQATTLPLSGSHCTKIAHVFLCHHRTHEVSRSICFSLAVDTGAPAPHPSWPSPAMVITLHASFLEHQQKFGSLAAVLLDFLQHMSSLMLPCAQLRASVLGCACELFCLARRRSLAPYPTLSCLSPSSGRATN
jgi:hypothetical protein